MLLFSTIFLSVLLLYALFIHSTRLLPPPIKTGMERFLASMYWNCCDNYRRECVAHWTKLLPMRLFIPNPSFRTSFRSLITCRVAQIHTSYSVAPMLVQTSLQTGMVRRKLGLGASPKKEATRLILIMTICSIGYHKSPQIIEMRCQK